MNPPLALLPANVLTANPKAGGEPLHVAGRHLEPRLLDFWRWSCSNLVSNATRGRLAQFIVATALGIETRSIVRDEWQAYDLLTPSGIKVEVKSATYLQSWFMESWFQKRPSTIAVRVGKRRGWSAVTNVLETGANAIAVSRKHCRRGSEADLDSSACGNCPLPCSADSGSSGS